MYDEAYWQIAYLIWRVDAGDRQIGDFPQSRVGGHGSRAAEPTFGRKHARRRMSQQAVSGSGPRLHADQWYADVDRILSHEVLDTGAAVSLGP
jgi:hypothetical protein